MPETPMNILMGEKSVYPHTCLPHKNIQKHEIRKLYILLLNLSYNFKNVNIFHVILFTLSPVLF